MSNRHDEDPTEVDQNVESPPNRAARYGSFTSRSAE